MIAESPPLVAIVDDDESVREALPDLLKQFGYSVLAFSSAQQFLASGCANLANCLIVDFAMPEMSGRELTFELLSRGFSIPTIFITAHKDGALRDRLLSDGAVECIFKPFSASEMAAALDRVFLNQ